MPNDIRQFVDSFHRDLSWWNKPLQFAFWGGEQLEVFIPLDPRLDRRSAAPTERQLHILKTMLNRQEDLRPYFELELFKRYQSKIYGTICYALNGQMYGQDEITPPIKEPREIWSLISEPSVWIDWYVSDEWKDATTFKLAFECRWDNEHGMGIQFRDWKIVQYGGTAD